MARFCRFWTFRPCDYWALTYREHQALTEWMDAEHRAEKRAAAKAASQSRRRRR